MLASKTIQVAFVFAAVGVGAVLFDTLMGFVLDYKVRYVAELFGLLSTMFAALTAKNAADNFISYRRETTVTAAPVKVE